MLDKQTIEQIKKSIKDINKEKDINIKLANMINMKDNIRSIINEELDELFSEVDLRVKRFQIHDENID